ncbi:MAG: HIT domain-containing protein [Bacteroidota bacterium]
MPSIFTKIIRKEIPSYIVAETENYIAILDAFPLVKGHTLVIPKIEVDKLFDLDLDLYLGFFGFSKKVSAAIESSVPCNRVSMHVVGLEVPHAHIHLIPINSTNDCNFANQKLKFSKEEFENTAKLISTHFKK